MTAFVSGIINRACRGSGVKETIEIIENMGPFHRRILLDEKRDYRMDDNLISALNYIDMHGFDTDFLV